MNISYYKNMPWEDFWALYRDDEEVLDWRASREHFEKRVLNTHNFMERIKLDAYTYRASWTRDPPILAPPPGFYDGPELPRPAMFRWLRQPRIDGGDANHWFHQGGWRGEKILGFGGYGQAGLFRRPQPVPPGERSSIVIKHVKTPVWEIDVDQPWREYSRDGQLEEEERGQDDAPNPKHQGITLGDELKILYALRGRPGGERLPSRHIVNVITNPNEDSDQPLPNEDRPSFPQIRRMTWYAMEFCENGSLESMLDRRARNKRTFDDIQELNEGGEVIGGLLPRDYDEEELWAIFSCFVKGLSMMDHGHEEDTVVWRFPAPIVHFDLKPDNILLGGYDDKHQRHYIHKIHDFGLAVQFLPQPVRDYEKLEDYRTYGTEGYWTPEQFTKNWDINNYKNDEIAGQYSTHTNIWGIGCIMWQLVMLSGPPPPKAFDMRDIDDMEEVRAGGLTYGKRLRQRTMYSKELRTLIWQCLHDKPRSRPSLEELRARVDAGKRASLWGGRRDVCSENPDDLSELSGSTPSGIWDEPDNVTRVSETPPFIAPNLNAQPTRSQPPRAARDNPIGPPASDSSWSYISTDVSSSESPSEYQPSSSEDEDYRSPRRRRRRR